MVSDGVFARFKRIVVAEMNDEGLYGFGQLATLLRARFCDPKIQSLTKTDGLDVPGQRNSSRSFVMSADESTTVTMTPVPEKLTKKALTADHPTWCPGCGDFAVLAAFTRFSGKTPVAAREHRDVGRDRLFVPLSLFR